MSRRTLSPTHRPSLPLPTSAANELLSVLFYTGTTTPGRQPQCSYPSLGAVACMAQRGIECGSSARSRASGRAGRCAGVEQEQGGAARLVRARRPASAAACTVAEARRRPACSATQRRAHGRAGQWAEVEQEQGCSVRLAQARAGRQALRLAVAGAQRRWPAVSAATYSARTARRPAQTMRRWWPCRHCSSCAASVSSSSPSHYSPPFLLSVTWNTCRC